MQVTYNQKELLLNCSGNLAHQVAQLYNIQTVYSLNIRFLQICYFVYVGEWGEENLPSHFSQCRWYYNNILYRKGGKKRNLFISIKKNARGKNNILSMNSGFKYTMSEGMNFCLATFQMILEMVSGMYVI